MSLAMKTVNWCEVHRSQFPCDKQCSLCIRELKTLAEELLHEYESHVGWNDIVEAAHEKLERL